MEQAKANLLNKYLLVGITEQLGDFVALLELMLPEYFSGAFDLYKNSKHALTLFVGDVIVGWFVLIKLLKYSL